MIVQLNKDNFEEEKKGDLVFIKFSAKTGCKYCTEFSPKYEASSNSNNNAKYCAYERESLTGTPLDEIENKYGVTGFPTVLAFKNGEFIGKMSTYKFFSDRELKMLILDEQKKLLNQENYVEDLVSEIRLRLTPIAPSNSCITDCETKCGDDVECKRDCIAHCHPEIKKELVDHLKEVKD